MSTTNGPGDHRDKGRAQVADSSGTMRRFQRVAQDDPYASGRPLARAVRT